MNESKTLIWGGLSVIVLVVTGTALLQLALLVIYHEHFADSCNVTHALLEPQCMQQGEQWMLRWPQDYLVPMVMFGGMGAVLMFVGLITSLEPAAKLEDVGGPQSLHDHIGTEHGFMLSDEHHYD